MPYFRFDFELPQDMGSGGSGFDLTVGDVRRALRESGGDLEGFVSLGESPGLSVIGSGFDAVGTAGDRLAEVTHFRLFDVTEVEQPPQGFVDPGLDYALPPVRVYCPPLKKVVPIDECPSLT